MKIGIITIHHAKFSYGAMLQAVATEQVCRRFSDDVEIINYENQYEQTDAKTAGASLKMRLKTKAVRFLQKTVYHGNRNPYRDSRRIDTVYNRVSKQQYTHVSQMQDVDYDVLISGSDQIWNPQITGEPDRAFLLDFGKARRRISYASSMGTHAPTEAEKAVFQECLQRYDAISVREQFAKDQLQPLVDKEIALVIDPTLLMTKADWAEKFPAVREEPCEPYILTFFVTNGIDAYWNEVEPYVRALNLPVWNVQAHTRRSHHVDKVLFAPTVEEFLRLLNNAAVVITNSFHGTAFSINFGKDFVPILARGNSSRVQHMLSLLGLSDRIGIAPDKAIGTLDYGKVQAALQEKREESLRWLAQAIGNAEE